MKVWQNYNMSKHKIMFSIFDYYFYDLEHFKNFMTKHDVGFKESDAFLKLDCTESEFTNAVLKRKKIIIPNGKYRLIYKKFTNSEIRMLKLFKPLGIPYQQDDTYNFKDNLFHTLYRERYYCFLKLPPMQVYTGVDWGNNGIIVFNPKAMVNWIDKFWSPTLEERFIISKKELMDIFVGESKKNVLNLHYRFIKKPMTKTIY